ncbi:MAG: SCO family protein [Crocinitomicaceae bacterium]|nr:SCO family protein [Crocinitomicaceae bacterium]
MNKAIIVIVILIIGVATAYFMTKNSQDVKQLPIIQPKDIKKEMVDPSLLEKGIGHRIGEFNLINQDGENITLADVKGKVFVAEYFFTTCMTICPKMTEQMTRVQAAFRNNENVKMLSFTVNPDYDDVDILKEYSEKYNALAGQWHFLTGTKEELYGLARKSFFVLKPAEAANLGDAGSDFIHTNNFVLVDRQLRIRGYYDGTSPDEVSELIADIQLLLKEA